MKRWMWLRAGLTAALAGASWEQATQRASLDSNGVQANGESGGYLAISISADGRFVAFVSDASNLVSGDTNTLSDVFVRDRQNGTTERVSVDSDGAQWNADSGEYGVSISASLGRLPLRLCAAVGVTTAAP
jgi:Tol biopolymer transport system component